ncbi:hypothetical protein D3C76_753440 [compost metagenome]
MDCAREARKQYESLLADLEAVPASEHGWRADLVVASSIKPQPISWLWRDWIARGKLTVLAGAGGTGKTTLALSLISTLTSGGCWPDGEQCLVPGNVLMWTSEDDLTDTLVPRLVAMGADLTRVHFIQGRINPDGTWEPFDPARDIDLLAQAVACIPDGVALLVLDPLVSAVAGDMHRANDVRRALQPVVDFAAAHSCAVLGISHFSKGSAGNIPAERVIGSQAFSALARAVLVAAKEENSDARVLCRAKSNIGVDCNGVRYSIEGHTLPDDIETTRVLWGDRIEGSAREILADVESTGDDDQRTELEEACDFLRDTLQQGPVPTKQIKEDANGAGLAWATVRRAQKAIGAKAKKDGVKEGWSWFLPTEDAPSAPKVLKEFPRCSLSDHEHLGESKSTLDEIERTTFDESDRDGS